MGLYDAAQVDRINDLLKNKPIGDDVDLKQIAQTTAGFTGADLENLLNESAIIAAKIRMPLSMQSWIRPVKNLSLHYSLIIKMITKHYSIVFRSILVKF